MRAKVAARRGDFETAQTLAQEAAELAEPTDAFNWSGNICLDQAEVLRLAGRPEDAAEAVGKAAELFEQKRNVVSTARARSLLSELSG